MRKGERNVLILIAVIVTLLMVVNYYRQQNVAVEEKELPFYSSADVNLNQAGSQLYRQLNCKNCHSLWGVRNIMQNVPAPALDGIGSLKSREWLFTYISAEDPQQILPSRLKAEYMMPSFAHLPMEQRALLADYLSSLKVKDWYLDELRKSECKKLTGESC